MTKGTHCYRNTRPCKQRVSHLIVQQPLCLFLLPLHLSRSARTTYEISDISRVVHSLSVNPRNLSACSKLSQLHPLSSIRRRGRRYICSSQEFQTASSRSRIVCARKREDEERTGEKEREAAKEDRDRKLNLALSRTAILKRRKKKDDETSRREQPHALSLFVFSVDRINCYDRYQHISDTRTPLVVVAAATFRRCHFHRRV